MISQPATKMIQVILSPEWDGLRLTTTTTAMKTTIKAMKHMAADCDFYHLDTYSATLQGDLYCYCMIYCSFTLPTAGYSDPLVNSIIDTSHVCPLRLS